MRIALVSQQFGNIRSGVGKYTHLLVDQLVSKGHDVTVIAPSIPEPKRIDPRIRVIECPTAKWDRTHGHWFSLSYYASKLLATLNQKGYFEIVHFTDARESLFFPASSSAVTIGTMHDYYFASSPIDPIPFKRDYLDWKTRYLYYHGVKIVERRAIRKMNHIICNSEFVQDQIIRSYKIAPHKTSVIYIGLEAPSSEPNFNRRINGKAPLRILFVGGNLQRKGLAQLIEAVKLLTVAGYQIEVDVIGENRARPKLMEQVNCLGLENNFSFWGYVDHQEINKFYQKADLFVMPSLMEAYGLVYLEAMHWGVPVIAGNQGGITELIEHQRNGILVDPQRPEQLKDSIVRVVKDPKLYQDLIVQGFATAKKMDIATTVSQTLELYTMIYRKKKWP